MTRDAPEFRFLSRWRILGTVDDVAGVLGDVREFARWWPSVYLDVDELEPGGEGGVGKRVRLRTKGWLPYTLYWDLRVTESHPHGFVIEAEGDLAGRGEWTFEQAGAWTIASYDWRVRAEKPLLRALLARERDTFSSSTYSTMRGSGDHHRIGSPCENHGKMPLA